MISTLRSEAGVVSQSVSMMLKPERHRHHPARHSATARHSYSSFSWMPAETAIAHDEYMIAGLSGAAMAAIKRSRLSWCHGFLAHGNQRLFHVPAQIGGIAEHQVRRRKAIRQAVFP